MKGTYNIFCEDCITGMDKLADGAVNAIIVDPPFGTTDCYWDEKLPLDEMWRQFLRVTKPNAAIVIFSQMPFGAELIMSQRKLFRYEWIWRKNLGTGFLNAKKMPLKCHENILVFYRKLPTYNPQFTEGKPWKRKGVRQSENYSNGKPHLQDYENDGRRYPLDVQKFAIPYASAEICYHPTQKPTDLLEYLIKTYTNEGETVLDATMGSGSTGVAAVNTGREFVGFEITSEYYEIAARRISDAMDRKSQELFSALDEDFC